MKTSYIYILCSQKNGTLYIGSTSNLIKRIYEHKNKTYPDSFTAKYNVKKLVYIEKYNNILDAGYREKCIKEWRRSWKIKLIEKDNPNWNELYSNEISV